MHPVTKMKRKKKFKSEANLSLAKSTGVISGTKIEYNTTSFILTVCEVVTVSKNKIDIIQMIQSAFFLFFFSI